MQDEQTQIRQRVFVHVGGYDALTPARFYHRFTRELARSAATWSFDAQCSEAEGSSAHSHWHVNAQGQNWSCTSSVHVLGWDDLIRADSQRSAASRLWHGLKAWTNMLITGTAWRYLRSNWRYFLFFLFPMQQILMLVLLAIGAGSLAFALISSLATSLTPFLAWFTALLSAALTFMIGYHLACRHLFLAHLLDDWIFAYEYAYRRRPQMRERVEAFSQTLLTLIEAHPDHELVILGHSMGAMLMMEAVAQTLQQADARGVVLPRLHVLAVGSSVLKVALHPSARFLRTALAQLACDVRVSWVEIQAIFDVMNFYKIDPVVVTGACRAPQARSPRIHTVRFKRMLSHQAIRKFFGHFFRLHNQFVMGNDRRYFYDYFLVLAGPVPFERYFDSTDTLPDAFSTDGAYHPQLLIPNPPRIQRSKLKIPLMSEK